MEFMVMALPAILLLLGVFFATKVRSLSKERDKAKHEVDVLHAARQLSDMTYWKLHEKYEALLKYEKIVDAEAEAERITREATQKYRVTLEKAAWESQELAMEAQKAREQAAEYERALKAIKNTIGGYGNEYIIPHKTLTDCLAEDYDHTMAGQSLKDLRKVVRQKVKNKEAAKSEYVQPERSSTAIDFITDAFNGKVESILARIRYDNYGKLKQEIIDAFNLVNFNGKAFRDTAITQDYLDLRLEELRLSTLIMELKEKERQEQSRIKEQMREEAKARKEFERAIKEAEKEESILKSAMEKARRQYEQASEEQKAEYEARLLEMEQKVKEAEEKNKRAISMAQQTRRGHVYVISNVGSFGDNVYKIGMTRRLEPMDRVKELGDASVPFSFDVHAMIWSEDAPALERDLHRRFALNQVNKVNHRKEFFKASIKEIREEVAKAGIEAKWTMAAEAREYQESQAIDRLIAEDPKAREDWLNRDFSLESLDLDDDTDLEEGESSRRAAD